MAKRIAAVHGHARLDWALLLDPVATDVLACWQALAHRIEASQQGQAPIAIGQVLRSDGLSVQRLQPRSGALVMRVGHQRWQLFPSPQALWTLQDRRRSRPQQVLLEHGLVSSLPHSSAVGFCSMEQVPGSSAFKVCIRLWRVERWQSPVDRARLEIV